MSANDNVSPASPSLPIRVETNGPPRRRPSSSSEELAHALPTSYSHVSPTLQRSFDPEEILERQRTMDADSAMQISRARSGSVALPHPRTSPILSHSPIDDVRFSMHMQHETNDSIRPQEHYPGHETLSSFAPSPVGVATPSNEPDNIMETLNAPAETGLHAALPMYQPNVYRSNFDFSMMEEFATDERSRLGLAFPVRPLASEVRRRHLSSQGTNALETIDDNPVLLEDGSDDVFGKLRQRKLSQSNPTPRVRSKKMALFEGSSGAPPPSLLYPSTSAPNVTFEENTSSRPRLNPLRTDSGHDRPYRFSFYSNSLPSTIHARSLSEIPGPGQSFQELFTGVDNADQLSHQEPPSSKMSKVPSQATSAGGQPDHLKEKRPGPLSLSGPNSDPESHTWWLDVLQPTDDEMRMLSKVFSIHPLTTEDIQMEETREKIELFRNYYLVCFRGFDQDQYSPTYLEPLNMYIIVFREGILSFHFHATPHPQNVRRRIKQLKDYISVTSDWISYALIDDITDAFGPLIQSIEYEVDSIDELVLILKDTEQSDMLRRIGTCRKKVMGLLRLMGNKADVVKGLAKRCNENWSVAPKSDIGLYLSDIQDHLITMTQNLNHYEKILSRSHSNYLAQISIEMTDANNQINDVLSKLTALGTVLIPMNLITGLWGMNVHVPGQDIQVGYTWFFSIIGALAGFALLGSFLAYRVLVSR